MNKSPVIPTGAWIWLELPRSPQMAITVAVVMAASGAGGVGLEARPAVAERALHRFIGCLIGGLAVLMVVSLALWPSVDERHGHG